MSTLIDEIAARETKEKPLFDAVTVTLNPAIDRTVTVSNFTAGEVNRVEQMRDTPGGKGVNVAVALADFGLTVAATGFLGGENCKSFEALFEQKQIADRFVRIAGRTRIGIKITDPIQGQTTDINFPGLAPVPSEIQILKEQIGLLDAPWFVLSGSLPPGVDPTIYRDLVKALKEAGRKVLLDTSGEPLRFAIEAAPSIIKPNLCEFEALLGRHLAGDGEVIEAARGLLCRGIDMIVVSMGKRGACFVTPGAAVIARAPEAEVVSTVGAGDAMVAGIIYARLRGLSLSECARLGTAFALDALTRIESGLSSPSAIKAGMDRVTLH